MKTLNLIRYRTHTHILVIVGALLVSVLVVATRVGHAQEEIPAAAIPRANTQMVANVDLQDCTHTIISEETKTMRIACSMRNTFKNQGDIRYGMQLVRKTEGGAFEVADTKVYDDVLSLTEGEVRPLVFEYTPPKFFAGSYEVWGLLRTSDNLPLSQNLIATLALNQTSSPFVDINSSSCYLTIKGEAEGIKYALEQGVDVDQNEVILGTCTITARSSAEMTITPEFEVRYRSAFGQVVSDVASVQLQQITLKAGETRELSVVIPKATIPQAYDASMVLVADGGGVVSRAVPFHYVVRGAGATIQNILLDKDYYMSGDTAQVSLYWSGSADNFYQSRKGPSASGASVIKIAVVSASGDVCAEEKEFPAASDTADSYKALKEYSLPITDDCVDPIVRVRIIGEDSQELVSKSVSVKSNSTSSEKITDGSASVWGVIYVIGGLLVLALVGMAMRKRNNRPNHQ